MIDTCGQAVNGCAIAQRTILVVEDDDVLRQLISLVLQGSGFAVLEAGAGFPALALSRAHERPIDLLITDIVLPGVDGEKLAERVQRERPSTKVLFISGHAAEIAPRLGAGNFLQKPFTPTAFLDAVKRLLAQ
jgi:two-component system, cell cycle sensor histidine kinase and response regulator CckA